MQVINEQLLLNEIPPPFTRPIDAKKLQNNYQPSMTGLKQTKSAVMKRDYDQRLEITRQQTQRYLIEEEERQAQKFKETKMKLIRGNDTIIKDVDAVLQTQAQEKQLTKERTFIDYEMNTFVPIHAAIQKQINEKYTHEYQTLKLQQHVRYVKESKLPGKNIDNIDENCYNPYVIGTQRVPVKIDDPVERANKVRTQEDRIVNNIDELISEQRVHFSYENKSLAELRDPKLKSERFTKVHQANKRNGRIDPSQWADVSNVIVTGDKTRTKRLFQDKLKFDAPITLDDK